MTLRRCRAMLRRCRAWSALPWREKGLFVGYLAIVAGLEVALRLLPPARLFPIWAASARRSGSPRRVADPRRVSGARQVTGARRQWLVARAAGVIRPQRTCLPAALLLWREALAEGTAARLVIGVRTGAAFLAHAWVEGPDATVLTEGGSLEGLTVLAVWGPDGSLLRTRPAV